MATPTTIEGTVTPITKPRTKRTTVPKPEATPGSPALDTLTGARPPLPTMLTTDQLTVHPANPTHRFARGFEDLAEVIRASDNRITSPLLVREVPPAGDSPLPSWEVLSGARRLAAARYLGMLVVPVQALRDVSDAEALAWVLRENRARKDFTLSEEADLVQAQLDLGISEEALAAAAGEKREWVARRREIAKLTAPARAVVDVAPETDLVQAAAIAEFADDAELVASLTGTAVTDPGQLAHEISRARQDREEAALIAAETAVWEAKGYAIITVRPGWGESDRKDIDDLSATSNGRGLTTKQHETCPGRAVYVTVQRTYGSEEKATAYVIEYCTTWKTAGHFNRHAQTSSGTTSGPMTEEQKAERKHLIETNKAAEAATPVRRAWLEEFFRRDKMPADALVYAAQILALHYAHPSLASALDLVGVKTTGYDLGAQVQPHLAKPLNAHKHLVALAVSVVEDSMPRDYHRSTSAHYGRHLFQLQTWGYTLAPHEQDVVDAWTKSTKAAKK